MKSVKRYKGIERDNFMTSIQELVDVVARGLPVVDAATSTVTVSRKGDPYLKGVSTMLEGSFVSELFQWWRQNSSNSLINPALLNSSLEVPYPGQTRSRCDAVFLCRSDGMDSTWAVEFKRTQMVGDNGKNNDYGIPKLLSPYLKDRSLRHDVERLSRSGLAPRLGVIGYSFKHSFALIEESLMRHPDEQERLKNLRTVCSNNDPAFGVLDPGEMVFLARQMLERSGLVLDYAVAEFENAWRHPCGGSGIVYGWEVRPTG